MMHDAEKNTQKYLDYVSNGAVGKVFHYPETLIIETGRKCNFSCAFCAEHGGGRELGLNFERPAYLPEDLFPKLFSACEVANDIELNGYSEPFFNEKMWEFIRLLETNLKKIRRNICIISNGSFDRNEKTARNAFGALIKRISISCHGFSEATRGFYQGGTLEQVLKNAEFLVSERTKQNASEVKLVLTFCLMKQNVSEIVDAVNYFCKIGFDAINISSLIPYKQDVMQSWNVVRNSKLFNYNTEMLCINEYVKEQIYLCKTIAKKYGKYLSIARTLNSELLTSKLKECFLCTDVL